MEGNSMRDFPLIKIDGKPLEKLLDVVSKAIGKIYEPRAIRNVADAKAYEITTLEKAKIDVTIYRQEIEQDTLDRIEERIIHRELRKQRNMDNVVKNAIKQLKDVSYVSDSPVDEDWVVRFFNIVEDVSDEQMQLLWGKILAGEVKSPNSFSIHTLELMKNLEKAEAELFTKAANYIIFENGINGRPFIFRGNNSELLNKNGFMFDERLKLIDLGLIQPGEIYFYFDPNPEDMNVFFVSGKYIINSFIKVNSPQYAIPVLGLTQIGTELIKLLTMVSVDGYIKDFYIYLQEKGIDVKYAYIKNVSENRIEHTEPWMRF